MASPDKKKKRMPLVTSQREQRLLLDHLDTEPIHLRGISMNNLVTVVSFL